MAGNSSSDAAAAAAANNNATNNTTLSSSSLSVAAGDGSPSTTSPSGTAHAAAATSAVTSGVVAIPATPRKFLCSAPRPEQWESQGVEVLDRLGPNAAAVLQQTIHKIRSLHRISHYPPKIGPGRKSNSVHALLFYQYLLDRVKNENTNNITGTGGEYDLLDYNHDENDQEDRNVEEEDETLSSMNTEDFVALHNDVCEVCEEQQQQQQQQSSAQEEPQNKLLLCSTCNLAFHLQCARPVLDEWPADMDQWRCSYCVLSTEPKHTKPRRVAAAAVRLMARIRNQRKRTHKKGGGRGDTTAGTPRVHRERVLVIRKGSSSSKKRGEFGYDFEDNNDDHDNNNEDDDDDDDDHDVAPDNNISSKTKKVAAIRTGDLPSGENHDQKGLTGAAVGKNSDQVNKKLSPSVTTKSAESEDVMDDVSVGTPKGGTSSSSNKPRSPKATRASSISSRDRDHADEKGSSQRGDEESAPPAKGGSPTKRSPKASRSTSSTRDVNEKGSGEKDGDESAPPKSDGHKKPSPRTTRACSSDRDEKGVGERNDDESLSKDGSNKKRSPTAAGTRSSGDADDDKGESMKKADSSTPPSAVGTPTGGSGKKRILELFRISDSLNDKFKAEGGLGKRVRKQPTLYNPQTVPASLWKSDEFRATTSSRDDDDSVSLASTNSQPSMTNDAESENSAGGEREREGKVCDDHKKDNSMTETTKETTTKVRRGRGSAVWCNFCGDDPGIKVCCFCACRVCFGKQARSKLLLCSSCNDQYHTYCLDPPLVTVPSNERWYCPTCKAAHERRDARTSSRLRVTVSSSVVAKDKTDDISCSSSPNRRSSSRVSPSKKEVDNNSTTSSKGSGRPRGRPRKTPSPAPSGGAGKKRGRPRSKSPAVTAPPKKRGRPPKSKSLSPGGTASKSDSLKKAPPASQSSTSKKGAVSAAVDSESQKSKPSEEFVSKAYAWDGVPVGDAATCQPGLPDVPAPVTMSRSGRPLKRSSFHDEIDQGAQHLRAGRPSNELQQRKAPPSSGLMASVVLSKQTAVASAVSFSEPPKSTPVSQPDAANTITSQVKTGIYADTTESKATSSTIVSERPITAVSIQASQETVAPAVTLTMTGPITVSSSVVDTTSSPLTLTGSLTADSAAAAASTSELDRDSTKIPRRKPGARECMQLSRRFGSQIISETNMEILYDYCNRGKVEHLIRMRERLDDHARFLESQLAGLEALVKEKGTESNPQTNALS